MVVRLFNLDLHISVIEDIKDITKRIFGDKVEITNWSISGHNWVFQKPEPPPTPINQQTWQFISPELVKKFQDKYDHLLETYDGFIVTHTPVFCLLFEKYKKPIVCINSCRFDQPYCWNKNSNGLVWLLTGLRRMTEANLLHIVSNNRADANYLLEFAKISSNVIPSLCLYTNATYTPNSEKPFLLHGDKTNVPSFLFNQLLAEIPKKHSWKELYEYQGIVHIPYEMSTMSIFEQLFAGVPLWFPTPTFYMKCVVDGTMRFTSMYNRIEEGFTLREMETWMRAADFYLFPHLYYYDSWEDLFQQLSNFTDPKQEERQLFIESVKKGVHEAWKGIFEHLFPALKSV